MYHAPLSQTSQDRLAVMRETNDGFVISEKDLEIRGPGEVLGTKQTGEMQFKIAQLLRDRKLLPKVQEASDQILALHKTLVLDLINRWIGKNEEFIHV